MNTLNSQSLSRRPRFSTPSRPLAVALCLLLLGASVAGFAYLQRDQSETAKPSPTASYVAQKGTSLQSGSPTVSVGCAVSGYRRKMVLTLTARCC